MMMLRDELQELSLERQRIIIRGAVRKMARAVAQSSDENLKRFGAFEEGLRLEGIENITMSEVRAIAGNMAKKSKAELDQVLPKFFEMFQRAGYGEMDIIEGAQLFCERLKE